MTKNFVYVIGAGASKEVNLPTGEELKDIISKLILFRSKCDELEIGDETIYYALRKYYVDNNAFDQAINAAKILHNALPFAISIDNFLDAHRDNTYIEVVGKLAIIKSILDAEKNSELKFEQVNASTMNNITKSNKLKESWYFKFFKLLTENCSIDELPMRLKSLTLIIFNYDRCVEYFLFNAFKIYYDIDDKESAELVSNIKIYHPYGKVGNLPWEEKDKSTEFGLEIISEKLIGLIDNIKTFNEGTANESDRIEIREKIYNADILVFLGFAFHKLNMDILKPEKRNRSKKHPLKCFASAFEKSISNQNEYKDRIKDLYSRINVYVEMEDLKCKEFMSEFSASLSF